MIRTDNWHWIILLAYAAGFLMFPPRVLLINDEERYVTQAVAFAEGRIDVPEPMLVAGDTLAEGALPAAGDTLAARGSSRRAASDYPPGTALLQAPFVAVAGWRGAAALSVVALTLLVLFTRWLLAAHGMPPAYALYILACAPVLVFARLAMSDLPAAALVALALVLLTGAERTPWQGAFAAGFASGACLLFREPVVVLLAPFALGLLRVPGRAVPLVAGGVAALALRGVLSWVLFGDAAYVRDGGFGFSLAEIPRNIPLYAVVLTLAFPLAVFLPFFYRGPRRAMVVSAFALYALVFLAYGYNAWRDNGTARGTLLAARFMIPALPLLCMMAADVLPRAASRLGLLNRNRAALLAAAGVGMLTAAIAIHPAARRLESESYALLRTVQNATKPDVPVVLNEKAAAKYLSPAYGRRLQVHRSAIRPEDLPALCRRSGSLTFVFLNRTDTELFRRDASDNAAFLAEAARHVTLSPTYRARLGPGTLEILEAASCGSRR